MINLFITGAKPKIQLVKYPENIQFIVVDLFCGAGGVTTGFAKATLKGRQIAIIAACVNHDPKALESHWKNHPDVVHFEEDIRTLELLPLVELINEYRKAYPKAKILLWASLECTNFSKAKGGQPRDADSRTLADHLHRYITALDPDYIQIENVVEFMSWGPLDKNGKPVSRRSGSDWLRWRESINNHGYRDDWRELNSADYGAYTARNRLFGCFAKPGLPIVWPAPTHAKNPKKEGLFGVGLKKWMPVKDVLDFEDEGISIFHRKKPLSIRTLERIYAGLIKYVAGGKDKFLQQIYACSSNSPNNYDVERPARTITTRDAHALVSASFLSTYNSGNPESRNTALDRPCKSLLTANTHAKVQCSFIQKYFSGKPEGKVISTNGPAGTITTSANQSLVQPIFMVQRNSGDPSGRIPSIDVPSRALTATAGNLHLVKTAFLAKYYGNGDNIQSVDEPAGTLTTKDRFTKAQVVWLDKTYNSPANHQGIDRPAGVVMANDKHQKVHAVWIDRNFTKSGHTSSIDQPAGAVMPVPKMNKVEAVPFILNPNYGNIGKSIDEPAPPLLASRRHYYIVNPSHGGHTMGTDVPCPVIVARQDKAPLYLMEVDNSPMLVFDAPNFLNDEDWAYILDGKGEISIRLKIVEFMFLYDISDVKMRMLKVLELLLIQGFPGDYVLVGNQSDQKKFIGNSVQPDVPKNWMETIGLALNNQPRIIN